MSVFNLETVYPVQPNGSQSSVYSNLPATLILQTFDDFRWKQYRNLQLQLNGSQTILVVTNATTAQWLRIILLPISNSGNIEVKLESNVTFYTTRKDVFGLVKLKVKNTIQFERIELTEARDYVEYFLGEKLDWLEKAYQDKVSAKKSAA